MSECDRVALLPSSTCLVRCCAVAAPSVPLRGDSHAASGARGERRRSAKRVQRGHTQREQRTAMTTSRSPLLARLNPAMSKHREGKGDRTHKSLCVGLY